MTENQDDKWSWSVFGGLLTRVISGLIAAGALVGAGYLARAGIDLVTAETTHPLIRGHAPAILGVPILAALAAAIVCCGRALDARSRIDLLGLSAEGAAAIILGWVIVFAALVTAFRVLW